MVAGRLQVKKDYYYIVLSYKNNDGKRKEKWFRTGLKIKNNKRKAEEILLHYRLNFNVNMECLNNAERVHHAEKNVNMLFGDYLLCWLEERKSMIELTTYVGYKNNLIGVIVPYFNERKVTVASLNARIIDEFYQTQLKRVSPNTVIRYHANIRKALADAVKDDLISCNYADKAHRPKLQPYIADYLCRDELLELFKAVKGKKIEFAVLMAAYYGLRREEIVGLKWSCINFKNKTITIKHTVVQCMLDGKFQVVGRDRGKTQKSIRTLPLIQSIEKMLLLMRANQEGDKEFFGEDYYTEYDEYVYKDPNGKIVKPSYISQNFARVIKNNPKFRKIRFHDLRHSCATLLRREGVPMEDIQKWLGHSDITTTERLYAHFEDLIHLKTAQRIENAFVL